MLSSNKIVLFADTECRLTQSALHFFGRRLPFIVLKMQLALLILCIFNLQRGPVFNTSMAWAAAAIIAAMCMR